jgi:hypothetical protein
MSCIGSHLGFQIGIKNPSETTNMIKAKLYMNVHWMVLYTLEVFCSDMKFKMAATAGLSLTLDPMGENVSKCFFSETTWTVETKLPRNEFVEDHLMNIHVQFGFNHIYSF